MDSQPFLHSQINNGYGFQHHDGNEHLGASRRLPFCWQVAAMDDRISHVRATASVMFPHESLRLVTAGRS